MEVILNKIFTINTLYITHQNDQYILLSIDTN